VTVTRTRRTFLIECAVGCGVLSSGATARDVVESVERVRYAQLRHVGPNRDRHAVAASLDRLVDAAGRPTIARATMLGDPVRGGRYPRDFAFTLHGVQGEQLVLTTHDDGGPELVVRLYP